MYFQLIALVILIIAVKLGWDVYKDYFSDQKKNAPYNKKNKKTTKRRTGNGEVIDISNAWISMDDLPYIKKDALLSSRDLALYELICDVIKDDNYIAFPKVRMAEIFTVEPGVDNRAEYLNRIGERSVDVLICQSDGLNPVLIVMDEGNIESRRKQQKLADRFARNAADAAGMNILTLNSNNLPDKNHMEKLLKGTGLKLEYTAPNE